MKRKITIKIAPIVIIVLLFVINLILGLSFPLLALRYVETDSEKYRAYSFRDDGTMVYYYEDVYNDGEIRTDTSGHYTVEDGKLNGMEKKGYSLVTSGGTVYTCKSAVTMQVFIALGYAACLIVLIAPFIKEFVKKQINKRTEEKERILAMETKISELEAEITKLRCNKDE